MVKMIENIEITAGVAIVALSWICGTMYSILRKNLAGVEGAVTVTIAYGVFRLIIFILTLPPR